MAALPEGTGSVLLSKLQHVEDTNRRKVVEYEQRNDWKGLATFAEDNLKRDPRTPDWLVVAGYAYTRLGQHGEAIRSYKELVRLEPDNTLGWALLADAYRTARQPEQAVMTLDKALFVRPDEAQLLYMLGESYTDMQRWQDAARAYRQSLKSDATSGPAWYGLGVASLSLQRNDEAREAANALDKIDQPLAQKLRSLLQPPR
ncbi:MAG TPA: tetratricopeptide repeat protein [Burkholderiales bacterium]|nr:tetratricopeptide repeat protein [Burkholderiales bacterium]